MWLSMNGDGHFTALSRQKMTSLTEAGAQRRAVLRDVGPVEIAGQQVRPVLGQDFLPPRWDETRLLYPAQNLGCRGFHARLLIDRPLIPM